MFSSHHLCIGKKQTVSRLPTQLAPQAQMVSKHIFRFPGKTNFPGSHLIMCLSISYHLLLVTCKFNSSTNAMNAFPFFKGEKCFHKISSYCPRGLVCIPGPQENDCSLKEK